MKRYFGSIKLDKQEITLYVKCDLIVGDVPILFICESQDNRLYLVELLNEDNNEFLLEGLSKKKILEMIEGETTIYNTFKSGDKAYVIQETSKADIYCVKNIYIADVIEDSLLPDCNVVYSFSFPALDSFKKELKSNMIHFSADLNINDHINNKKFVFLYECMFLKNNESTLLADNRKKSIILRYDLYSGEIKHKQNSLSIKTLPAMF